jgi:DNA (cytosine-5)-methyltransferase 1
MKHPFAQTPVQPARRRPLTALDLFCGCGGLTLGLKHAGFTVRGAVEIDGLAVQTYRANHPEVTLWHRDIRELSTGEVLFALRIRRGELDLLAGCPPCQGFSSMTTLNGARRVNDERNDLVFDFLRFVKGTFPKTVMLENVPGLASDGRFERLCNELQMLGYHVRSEIKNAQNFGVAQRRRRLILLAGRTGHVPMAREDASRVTVREAIGEMPVPGASGDPIHDMPEERSPQIRRLITEVPHDGGSRLDRPRHAQLPCHQRCNGFKDVYGRMAWDDVAPTITSGCFNPSKGRFLHPEQDRAITMREAALLQGFPRDYAFPDFSSKQAIALMIGNALPPEFIRRHAAEIQKVI